MLYVGVRSKQRNRLISGEVQGLSIPLHQVLCGWSPHSLALMPFGPYLQGLRLQVSTIWAPALRCYPTNPPLDALGIFQNLQPFS